MIHWLAPYLFSEDMCRLLGYISVRAGGAAVSVLVGRGDWPHGHSLAIAPRRW